MVGRSGTLTLPADTAGSGSSPPCALRSARWCCPPPHAPCPRAAPARRCRDAASAPRSASRPAPARPAARARRRRARRRRSSSRCNACTSAASSITGPREVLMTNAVGFISANCRVAHQVPRRRAELRMQRDEIRLAQQVVEAAIRRAELLLLGRRQPVRVGIDDLHLEAARAARRRPDRCGRSRPGRASCRSPPRRRDDWTASRDRRRRGTACRRTRCCARPTSSRPKRDVGGGVGDDRRNVGHRNAELGRRRKIDAVLRDVHRRHGLEIRIGREHVGDRRCRAAATAGCRSASPPRSAWPCRSTRLESGLTSTSATARSRASALSAIGWVTKTRGPAHRHVFGFRRGAALTFGITFSASKVHRTLGQRRVAPVLAGIEQRAEIADPLAELRASRRRPCRASRG